MALDSKHILHCILFSFVYASLQYNFKLYAHLIFPNTIIIKHRHIVSKGITIVLFFRECQFAGVSKFMTEDLCYFGLLNGTAYRVSNKASLWQGSGIQWSWPI
jgi:hypothetical protein